MTTIEKAYERLKPFQAVNTPPTQGQADARTQRDVTLELGILCNWFEPTSADEDSWLIARSARTGLRRLFPDSQA